MEMGFVVIAALLWAILVAVCRLDRPISDNPGSRSKDEFDVQEYLARNFVWDEQRQEWVPKPVASIDVTK